MPDWTFDTCIEITDKGRAALRNGNPTSPALLAEEEETGNNFAPMDAAFYEDEPNPYAGTYSEE